MNKATNEDDSLIKYIKGTQKAKPLTIRDEIEFAQLIRKGDKKALNNLIKPNLKFVVTIAKQYQNQGLSFEDLISEGNLGLIKAAKKFDETRGFRFITYAVWWIRQSILNALSEYSRVVRVPIDLLNQKNIILKAIRELEQINERPPNTIELAEYLGKSIYEVVSIVKYTQTETSLNTIMPVTDFKFIDEDYSDNETKQMIEWLELVDNVQCADEVMPDFEMRLTAFKSEINRALDTLSEREKDIVTMYYGLEGNYPLTLEEIGDKYKLTKERVRQIKEKAIRRLRQPSRSKSLKTYLE